MDPRDPVTVPSGANRAAGEASLKGLPSHLTLPGMELATTTPPVAAAPFTASLRERYRTVCALPAHLCEPLAVEDYVVQTMQDVSPTKWHLAHTTWFWETFVLREHVPGYAPFHERYAYLFNSYYVQAGERHCRDRRGYLSRPTVAEVFAYRAHVDAAMDRLLEDDDRAEALRDLLDVGLNHEQQHQELLLTDIKHVFSVNPLRPVYRAAAPGPAHPAPPLGWVGVDEGVYEIGHAGPGFAFDNETPRHRVFLEPFALATRLVTCGEYLDFMRDGGYRTPTLWLSEGWATVQARGWTEPFYWEDDGAGGYAHFTLAGMRPVDPAEPVCHLSFFEAEAFARWAGARLPTEAEWEVAAAGLPLDGPYVESGRYHPSVAPDASGDGAAALTQLYGDVWQWTRSQYDPYPGYAPAPGALGEYNGKFMCNQFVLRGASCATSRTHARPTYRNFFPPDACWQFTGLRLARNA
jgi:ergothioneine biosynthesis protein EgtB